jgi:molybdopterin biosynthesis enzyme
VRARLASTVTSPAGRHQFYPVRLQNDAAVPAFKGSGDITSMAGADGYFEIPEDVERVDAGTLVEVKRF